MINPYIYPGLQRELNHYEVNYLVSKYFKVPFDDLFLKCRKRGIVEARQAGMYLMRKYTTNTLKDIANNYSLNHATACYASNTAIPNLIKYDWEYKMKIEKVETAIENGFNVKVRDDWDAHSKKFDDK